MDQDQKKYILDNIGRKSIDKLARELNIRERKIRKFIEKNRSRKEPAPIEPKKECPSLNKKTVLALVIIAFIGLTVYFNSLDGGFIWDDVYLVRDNTYIKSWEYAPDIFFKDIAAGAKTQSNFYRPLQILSYMVDYSIWGLNVKGYHLTNMILHILTAFCVFALINTLFKDRRLSLITSLLFTVHPALTEAVSYMSGRADLLASLFLLLSLLCYIVSDRSGRVVLYSVSIVCYVFALLSRENALIFPLILLLYHYSFGRKPDLKRYVPILGLACVYVIFRFTVLKHLLPHLVVDTTVFQRLPGFFVALAEYIRILILPLGLHMEYGNRLFSLSDPKALAGVAVLIGSIFILFNKRRSSTLVFFSIAWFFLLLLPQSNLYPINAYMAEHWLYLPSIGVFLLIAKALSWLYSKDRVRIVALGLTIVIIAALSFLAIKQNSYWKNPEAFYNRVLEYSPESFRAHNSLGIIFEKSGEYDKAIASYIRSIEHNPYFVYAYHNLGKIYAAMGKNEDAISWYKKALSVSPHFGGTYYNLGNLYGNMERYEEAIASYKRAIELYPEYSEAYFNLGFTYKKAGMFPEAVDCYRRSLEIEPGKPGVYNNLGNVYGAMGKTEEAMAAYADALRISPDSPDVLNNLGALYSYIGKEEDAVGYFMKAIEVDPDFALTYNNLAVIYLNRKDYEEAIRHCDKAKDLGRPDPAILEALEPYRKQ